MLLKVEEEIIISLCDDDPQQLVVSSNTHTTIKSEKTAIQMHSHTLAHCCKTYDIGLKTGESHMYSKVDNITLSI